MKVLNLAAKLEFWQLFMKLLLIILFFSLISCKNEKTNRSNDHRDKEYQSGYFLICTDPIAYSHHIDYSNSGKYCHGLRNCIKRGYEVKKLPEEEALKIREDPCDYCYGH